MAYNSVGTPVFYCDNLQWWQSLGMLGEPNPTSEGNNANLSKWIGLNPAANNPYFTSGDSDANYQERVWFSLNNATQIPDTQNLTNTKMFYAILGHNYFFTNLAISGFELSLDQNAAYWPVGGSIDVLVNHTGGTNHTNNYTFANGWTLQTYHPTITDIKTFEFQINGFGDEVYTTQVKTNSFAYGTAYTMPHSPDMNLTLEYDYSGTTTQETAGGASLSNTMWNRPPNWNNLGPWELDNLGQSFDSTIGTEIENQTISKSGRRIWTLSFSFLSGQDIFGPNQMIWDYGGTSGMASIGGLSDADSYDTDEDIDASGDHFTTNILTDDSFYSQVLHKVGTQHRFIFQPDSNNNHPTTGFAICKFDKGFRFKQVSANTYSFAATIREVW